MNFERSLGERTIVPSRRRKGLVRFYNDVFTSQVVGRGGLWAMRPPRPTTYDRRPSMSICVWCGFDRLQETAELCEVCGQTPDSHSVTIERSKSGTVTEERGSAPAPDLNRRFAERYRIEGVVGRGGMGSVFRVVDEKDGATYALKVLHAAPDGNAWSIKRFRREAEILARIAHRAVPRIHDFGVADGAMYLVTDFIDGTNLRDVIASKGALPLAEIVRIGSEIADCLNAAHEH